MALQTLAITEQNTAPAFQVTCERNGTVIDLTGSTVNLIISRKHVQTNSGHTSCTTTNAAQGIISYTPQAGDFPVAGNYFCDVSITYSNNSNEVLHDQMLITARPRSNSTT